MAAPAFLMASAMNWLARTGQDLVFALAWGINGSLSVVGAVAGPRGAVAFGLSDVLTICAATCLLAIPAFLVKGRLALIGRPASGQQVHYIKICYRCVAKMGPEGDPAALSALATEPWTDHRETREKISNTFRARTFRPGDQGQPKARDAETIALFLSGTSNCFGLSTSVWSHQS